GWLTDEVRTEREKWAPDMLKDPTMRKIDRLFPHIATIAILPDATIVTSFVDELHPNPSLAFLLDR
ncbi:MAG TPA: hypothetical protein VG408_06660, partial [Actinomycetota bacterium]|nr:hypothetical protein [Actinomycetota bacterium]